MSWRNDLEDSPATPRVLIARGKLTDERRQGRQIPYKAYYPDQAGTRRLPLIVWSHGLGGSADGAGFLARYLAARGYTLLHLTHPGTDMSLWEGKPGHPWEIMKNTPISRKATLDRFRDVRAVVGRLEEIAAAHPDFGAAMDAGVLGMSGHSFGAITTQVMAGQKLGRGRRMYDMREPRFRAAIAYSMSPAHNAGGENPDRLYGSIAIPALYMTGTEDYSPISGRDYLARLPVFRHAGGPEQHLVVLNGADHMVFAGSRGMLPRYDSIPLHETIIKTVSLAFWDAYLRQDAAAHEWLTGDGIAGFIGGEGTHEYRA